MYNKNKPDYQRSNSFEFTSYLNSSTYGIIGSSISKDYQSLISESKCRCRGTCRTSIGCTCK